MTEESFVNHFTRLTLQFIIKLWCKKPIGCPKKFEKYNRKKKTMFFFTRESFSKKFIFTKMQNTRSQDLRVLGKSPYLIKDNEKKSALFIKIKDYTQVKKLFQQLIEFFYLST